MRQAAFEPRRNSIKVLRTSAWKPRPESGLDRVLVVPIRLAATDERRGSYPAVVGPERNRERETERDSVCMRERERERERETAV